MNNSMPEEIQRKSRSGAIGPFALPLNRTLEAARQDRARGFNWLKVILYWGIYVICMIITGIVGGGVLGNGLELTLFSYTITTIICVWLILTVGKRTPASLGMFKQRAGIEYATGSLYAVLCLLFVWGVNYAFKAIDSQFNKDFSPSVFLVIFMGFVFQGFMEEFLLRGLIFTQVSLKIGVFWGIMVNSLIFGFGHTSNANASLISVTNTLLIGIVFSLIYYYHDNIWIVSGFHSIWNFVLGPVLGSAVSGFELPTSLLKTEFTEGMGILNGGGYGFEAAGIVTLMSVAMIAIYVFLLYKKLRQTPELK